MIKKEKKNLEVRFSSIDLTLTSGLATDGSKVDLATPGEWTLGRFLPARDAAVEPTRLPSRQNASIFPPSRRARCRHVHAVVEKCPGPVGPLEINDYGCLEPLGELPPGDRQSKPLPYPDVTDHCTPP